MPNALTCSELEAIRRVRRLWEDLSRKHPGTLKIANAISRKWRTVLFGGTIRDLMLRGSAAEPRDLDLVVDNDSNDDISAFLASTPHRRNRFGGVCINDTKLRIDLWNLTDTWAMAQRLIPAEGFHALPRTTFLNVEAVAITLTPDAEQQVVYSHGFFEALEEKVLRINLEENPFPLLCVVRTFKTAFQLQLSIDQRLGAYLIRHGADANANELRRVQLAHYGEEIFSAVRLQRLVGAVRQDDITHFSELVRAHSQCQDLSDEPFNATVSESDGFGVSLPRR